MGRGFTLLICLLSLTLSAFAVQPDSLWAARFGGGNHDVCNAMAPTTDGGYVLAGWTRTYGAGWYDFWMVKINATGQEVWNHTYGGAEGEGCFGVQQTPDGGFILAGMTGTSDDSLDGASDAFIVKTDADGNAQWTKRFGGNLSDGFYAVQNAPDGGYVFAGFTDSYGAGSRDFWLLKTNAQGDSLWSHTYGGGGVDECHALTTTTDGGYALAGVTESFRQRDGNFFLVRVDANGEPVWNTATASGQVFGTIFDENCYSVVQSLDGGFALAGSTVNGNTGYENFYLVRTRPDGTSMWTKTYGVDTVRANTRELCYAMQATQDSSYVLSGITASYGAGLYDFWLVKADPRGNVVYRRTFGGMERDNCYAMLKTSDGGFLMGGYTRSFGATYEDAFVVKTGADILVTAPGNFSLLSPGNDTTFASNTDSVVFFWQAAANQDIYYDTLSYRLLISDDLTFDPARTDTSPALRDSGAAFVRYAWKRMLVANVPHYWKVQAMDFGGWTTWSTETRVFTITGTAPSSFDLLTPADNTVMADSFSVRFTWTAATDPDPGDGRSYTLYVSADSTFARYDSMTSNTTSATWTKLIIANQPAFWKVLVTDRHGLSTWSNQVFRFTITAHAPEPFALIQPTNGEQWPLDRGPVTFIWAAAVDTIDTADSASYIVYVSGDSTFATYDSMTVAEGTQLQWVRPLEVGPTYWWHVKATDLHGLSTLSATWSFTRVAGPEIQQPPAGDTPTVFKLHQNYPNPFNATTEIAYDLPNAGFVTVKVFNVLGREVETLVNQNMPAGKWRTSFSATDLPSGLYILQVKAPGVTEMKKMILLK